MAISRTFNGVAVTIPEQPDQNWGDYTTAFLDTLTQGAIAKNQIVNDLTSGGVSNVLSAQQGKVLKDTADVLAATAVSETMAAAGAGNVMVSGGADRSIIDSGIAATKVPTMAAVGGAGELLLTAAGDRAVSKSGVLAANVVTASGTLTSGALMKGAGTKTSDVSTVTAATLETSMGAWQTHNTTITSGTGTITSTTSTILYCVHGKTVFLRGIITITNNGTGATDVRFTLPHTPKDAYATGVFRETQTSGITGSVTTTSNTIATIQTYNNAYPVTTNSVLRISLVYEIA